MAARVTMGHSGRKMTNENINYTTETTFFCTRIADDVYHFFFFSTDGREFRKSQLSDQL